jgi:hypothetical protein
MHKFISTTLAGVLLGATVITSVTPAAADPRRDSYMENYYQGHDRDRDYWRWRSNRHSWNDREYRDWYGRHRDRHDRDFNPAAAIFGFAAGAIAAGAANAIADSSHVARCEARYNSYDRSRDAFFGYDGQWHRCRL